MAEKIVEQEERTEEIIPSEVEVKHGVIRWLIRETLGIILVGVILFLAAGTWQWPMAWVLLGIYAAWFLAQAIVIIPRNPDLLAERASRKKEITWDTKILSIIGLLVIVKYILAGLDYRFAWSPDFPIELQVITALLAALGYALGAWAMISNAFFSLSYRIQEDRGHAVVSAGPYRIVRHPAYLGTIVFELATPIMLGSMWALIPGAVIAWLFVMRTAREDRALQAELDGYADYSQSVGYRLLPGIW